MKTIIGMILLLSLSAASAETKPAVTSQANSAQSLTKEQQEFVKSARKAFKDAEKSPPPSDHMQNKMQSGVKQ